MSNLVQPVFTRVQYVQDTARKFVVVDGTSTRGSDRGHVNWWEQQKMENWWDVLSTGPNTNYDQFALSSWLVRRLETEPALYVEAVSSLDGYLQSLAYRKNRLLDDVVRVVGVIAARTGYGRDLAAVLKHPRNWERIARFGSNATMRDAATTILLYGVMSDTERYHRTLVMLKEYTNPSSKFVRFDLFDTLVGTWFSPANNSYGGKGAIERRALYRPELRAAMYAHFLGATRITQATCAKSYAWSTSKS